MTALLAYMKASGKNQTEMAALTGVPQSQFSLYLRGLRRPSLQSALAIERATGGEVSAASWTTSQTQQKRSGKRGRSAK